MRQIRWVVSMLLITGLVIVLTPPSSALEILPDDAGSEHTSVRLIAALGTRTLQIEQSELPHPGSAVQPNYLLSSGGRSETLDQEQIKSPNRAFLSSLVAPGGRIFTSEKPCNLAASTIPSIWILRTCVVVLGGIVIMLEGAKPGPHDSACVNSSTPSAQMATEVT